MAKLIIDSAEGTLVAERIGETVVIRAELTRAAAYQMAVLWQSFGSRLAELTEPVAPEPKRRKAVRRGRVVTSRGVRRG